MKFEKKFEELHIFLKETFPNAPLPITLIILKSVNFRPYDKIQFNSSIFND